FQDQPNRWRATFVLGFTSVTYGGYFLAVNFISCADELILLISGPNWEPASTIFKYLSLSLFAATPMNAMGWIYVSLGDTRRMFHWGFISTGIFLTSFVIGLPYGANGMSFSYSCASWILLIPCLANGARKSPISLTLLLKLLFSPFLCAVA